jgi:isocitrate/isopropylmalate dehydrogenase
MAAIISAAMMLDFLGQAAAADRITKAVADYRQQGHTETSATTSQIGDAIAERV